LKDPEWQTETESDGEDIEALGLEISEELSTKSSVTPIESFQLFLPTSCSRDH